MPRSVILCVDDEKSILDVLYSGISKEMGEEFDIELCDNPFEALEVVKDINEDPTSRLVLIVTDQLMPGMTGQELLNNINQSNRDLPKILLSGHTDLESIQKIINETGLYRYITKPWYMDDLLMNIQQAAKSYIHKLELDRSNETNRELKIINQITQELSSFLHLDPLIACMGRLICSHSNMERAFLTLFSINNQAVQYFSLERGEKFSQSWNTAQFKVVEEHEIESKITQKPYSVLISLETNEGKVGRIYFENNHSRKSISETEHYLLKILASQLTISLNHVKLHAALQEQKKIVEYRQLQMMDSIKYARKIQLSLLSNEADLKTCLKNSFAFYRPRDIVSGDFYWVHQFKTKKRLDKTVLIVGDCTGHGVAGAFMTIMSSLFLRKIVAESKIIDTAEILYLLDKQISGIVETGEREILNMGMDVSVMTIDHVAKKIYYSGAKRPLYMVYKGRFEQIKGDYKAVGYGSKISQERYKLKSFKVHEIPLRINCMYYMCSDGYLDQFGGKDDKKYGRKRFQKLLTIISKLSAEEQKRCIEQSFIQWKGAVKQIDDVVLLGFRL